MKDTSRPVNALMGVWVGHFNSLAKSRANADPGLTSLREELNEMEERLHTNEEYLIDIPFSTEEVAGAIHSLKCSKAAGPDGLEAEHLSMEVRVY